MITVAAPPGSIAVGRLVELSAGEEHHLLVRRAGDRAVLRVVDGAGTVGWGRLGLAGSRAAVEVERAEQLPPPPVTILAAGAGDRDRFLTLAEKSVELGVTRLLPLETERSRSVAGRYREQHREKLERRAFEAMKQSGNPWLPDLGDPVPLATLLATDLPPARWLAQAGGTRPALDSAGAALVIAVGPEGGFTEDERQALGSAGFRPVALGPHVLRFDTAAVAALTSAWQLRRSMIHE